MIAPMPNLLAKHRRRQGVSLARSQAWSDETTYRNTATCGSLGYAFASMRMAVQLEWLVRGHDRYEACSSSREHFFVDEGWPLVS